jgi:hypothetical protein
MRNNEKTLHKHPPERLPFIYLSQNFLTEILYHG